MGLQGIFDPMVSAYFENKYGEGGGSGGSCRALVWGRAENRGFPSITIEEWGGTFYRIADPIAKDELDGSIFLSAIGGTIVSMPISEDYGNLMCAEEDGLRMAAVFAGAETVLMASFDGDSEAMMGVPPGFYVSEITIGAAGTSENYYCHLILGSVEVTEIFRP